MSMGGNATPEPNGNIKVYIEIAAFVGWINPDSYFFLTPDTLKINEFISVVGAPAKKLKKKVDIQSMASANILFIVSVL